MRRSIVAAFLLLGCEQVMGIPERVAQPGLVCTGEGECMCEEDGAHFDCDGRLENGCEDVTSDPDHCGCCNRGCRGGACVAGVCQPVVLHVDRELHDTRLPLVVDESSLYFLSTTPCPDTARVCRLPHEGPGAESFAEVVSTAQVFGLAVGAEDVCFSASNGAIGCRDKDSDSEIEVREESHFRLAVGDGDDGHVYWTDVGLFRAPLQDLATREELAPGQGRALAVLGDESVFWVGPPQGAMSNRVPLLKTNIGSPSTTEVIDDEDVLPATGVVVSGHWVYYLRRVGTADLTVQITRYDVVQNVTECLLQAFLLDSFAVHGDFVYFTRGDHKVQRFSVSDAPAASGSECGDPALELVTDGGQGVGPIAVVSHGVDTLVYWQGVDEEGGRLLRIVAPLEDASGVQCMEE